MNYYKFLKSIIYQVYLIFSNLKKCFMFNYNSKLYTQIWPYGRLVNRFINDLNSNLLTFGVINLDPLSSDEIKQINLGTTLIKSETNSEIRYSVDDGVRDYLFKKYDVKKIFEKYLNGINCSEFFYKIDCWSNKVGINKSENSKFHRDYDYKYQLKFIFILSKTSINDGSHEVAEYNINAPFYFNAIRRYPDNLVYKYFKTTQYYGEAGLSLLVNTRNLHRAVWPKSINRKIIIITCGAQ